MTGYVITEPRHEERNFLADSWRRSMQSAPAYSAMPTRAFVYWATQLINKFIGADVHRVELRDDDFLLVARDKDRPAYVLGWLMATDTKPGCAIHWVYVRRSGEHRRQGLAADLIATAIERCEPGDVTYGVRTRFDEVWERLGLTFRPIQEFEKSGGGR